MLEQGQRQRANHHSAKRSKREGLTLEPVRQRAKHDDRPEIQNDEDRLRAVDVEADGAFAVGTIDLYPGHDGLGEFALS